MIADIKIIKHPGPTRVYDVDDRTTSGAAASIKPGEPVKKGGSGDNFVILLATGDPEIGTDEFVGVARAESTETATVDGTVEVVTLIPNRTVLRAKVTTPANIDTAAELLGIKNDSVTFDLANGIFTVDEDEGSDPNVHGLRIIGGDIVKGTVDFIVNVLATDAGTLVGQTMD